MKKLKKDEIKKKYQFNKLFQIKQIKMKRMRSNLTDKKVEGG
jgi:hypothetical protein